MSSNEKIEPMQMWREWFVKSEKAWSQALTDMMGDERFSQGMGKYMQEALHSHRMFSEAMSQYLANLNLPSRSDVLDLGDRLGQIEDTLAALQVELRDQRKLFVNAKFDADAVSANTDPRPARTKQPPSKA
ncbi:MAG: hypothetical protein EXR86_06290 [Gammaproteobacteria bacterium]|nr:hypothetical protein [Gammaproteobacteria bacterium]